MATGRVPTTANSPLTAKGDVFTYSTAPARLAVGNNGDTLVADSAATTGLRWQPDFSVGRNKIINGDFNINQRQFTSVTTNFIYTFDRWVTGIVGNGTSTFTPQIFTPGAAPVAPYESTNFIQIQTTGQTDTNAATQLLQFVEDVRTLNGVTTVSFWAKAASGTPKVAVEIRQGFGSGGSASVDTYFGQVTLSTSWARYSVTGTIPSVSGKTIGAGSSVRLALWVSAGTDFNARTGSLGIQTNTFGFWGVQWEQGSVATPFTTATGTLQGELAACQRYYVRYTCESVAPYAVFAPSGMTASTTQSINYTPLPVQMRSYPVSVEWGGNLVVNATGATVAVTGVAIQDRSNTKITSLTYTVASGLTANQYSFVRADNSSTAFIGINAEL
jgi:hypothetical protein